MNEPLARPLAAVVAINSAANDLVDREARGEPVPVSYKITPAGEVLASKSRELDCWQLPQNVLVYEVPPQRYAVERIAPTGAVTGLAGAGKVGKSFFALELALSVAAGRCTFGLQVEQGPAWYFSAEDRKDRLLERAKAILVGFTPEERARAIANFHAVDAVGESLFFVANRGGANEITDVPERLAARIGTAALVIVDTVSRINPLRESDNEVLALVVSGAERIARQTGAAVLLVHHTGKANARAGVADLYSGRGGSSFGDNVRSLLVMNRLDEAAVRSFSPAMQDEQRQGNLVRLTHAASSYGREMLPVILKRRDNGTLERIEAASDMLERLQAWAEETGTATFSKKQLSETFARRIWPTHTPARSKILAFIDESLESGALLPAEGKFRGGPRFRLSPATVEDIEDADARTLATLEEFP